MREIKNDMSLISLRHSSYGVEVIASWLDSEIKFDIMSDEEKEAFKKHLKEVVEELE